MYLRDVRINVDGLYVPVSIGTLFQLVQHGEEYSCYAKKCAISALYSMNIQLSGRDGASTLLKNL